MNLYESYIHVPNEKRQLNRSGHTHTHNSLRPPTLYCHNFYNILAFPFAIIYQLIYELQMAPMRILYALNDIEIRNG